MPLVAILLSSLLIQLACLEHLFFLSLCLCCLLSSLSISICTCHLLSSKKRVSRFFGGNPGCTGRGPEVPVVTPVVTGTDTGSVGFCRQNTFRWLGRSTGLTTGTVGCGAGATGFETGFFRFRYRGPVPCLGVSTSLFPFLPKCHSRRPLHLPHPLVDFHH